MIHVDIKQLARFGAGRPPHHRRRASSSSRGAGYEKVHVGESNRRHPPGLRPKCMARWSRRRAEKPSTVWIFLADGRPVYSLSEGINLSQRILSETQRPHPYRGAALGTG